MCANIIQAAIVVSRMASIDATNQPKHEMRIDNDKTLNILGKISLSLCESGTDFIAPSSMMDGQILYLSNLLEKRGFKKVKIMSYSAKHNSCLYSPFRNYNYHNTSFIDKSSYQSNFNNPRESMREILHDVKEGSDWVMIKPSFWYMDLVRLAKNLVDVPLVVQNVSGEYALLKAGSKIDPIDQREWIVQYLKSLRRAGADKIISYLMLDLFVEFEKNPYIIDLNSDSDSCFWVRDHLTTCRIDVIFCIICSNFPAIVDTTS